MVYVTDKVCEAPNESKIGSVLLVVSPTTELALRLAEILMVVLATAGLVTPVPTCRGCKLVAVFTTPLTAGYPSSNCPPGVVICPKLLAVKSPARVKSGKPFEL